jgi:hypothetical protein
MTAPTTLTVGTPWLAGGREGLSLLAGAAAKEKTAVSSLAFIILLY